MARSIATTNDVNRDELLEFVRPRHNGILVVHRQSGGLQTSPVTMGVGDDGTILIASYPSRAKVHNLRADPRATMTVLSDDFNGPWVQIDGAAEVVDLPDAVDVLVEYFRNIAGDHDDWDEYRRAMRDQGKCAIRMTVASWGPIATGGFPPDSDQD